MHMTLGAFAFLPDLTEEQICRQIDYCISNDWTVAIEFAAEVQNRDTQWDTWGVPMFDVRDAKAVLAEIRACREAHPKHYIRISAFDPSRGWETVRLSFIINRPRAEPVVRFDRSESQFRALRHRAQPQPERRAMGARL